MRHALPLEHVTSACRGAVVVAALGAVLLTPYQSSNGVKAGAEMLDVWRVLTQV